MEHIHLLKKVRQRCNGVNIIKDEKNAKLEAA